MCTCLRLRRQPHSRRNNPQHRRSVDVLFHPLLRTHFVVHWPKLENACHSRRVGRPSRTTRGMASSFSFCRSLRFGDFASLKGRQSPSPQFGLGLLCGSLGGPSALKIVTCERTTCGKGSLDCHSKSSILQVSAGGRRVNLARPFRHCKRGILNSASNRPCVTLG